MSDRPEGVSFDTLLLRVEVRSELVLGDEPRCLSDDGSKRAGVKLAVVGNGDDLALSVGTGVDQLDVAAPLRGPGEPKSLEDGNYRVSCIMVMSDL